MSDKPLHVQVAEALGWKLIPLKGSKVAMCRSGGTEVWVRPDGGHQCARCESIPAYDTDWSATGPLIEKYEIEIDKRDVGWCAVAWNHAGFGHRADPQSGVTPLIAVCHLILALHAAGKLDADQTSEAPSAEPDPQV